MDFHEGQDFDPTLIRRILRPFYIGNGDLGLKPLGNAVLLIIGLLLPQLQGVATSALSFPCELFVNRV
jgi:hypothetical protein